MSASNGRSRAANAFVLLAAMVGFSGVAAAADEAIMVEEVRVYATPLQSTTEEVAQPVVILSGEALDRALAATLGETLDGQPGVNTSYFGPAVGRPIIRGLGGPRVRILEDGIVAADVSATSDDHAVTVEPYLADQIEVLKGPATVLYGSGAIGGVVNSVSGRVPTELPEEAFSLRATGNYNDVGDETGAGIRSDVRTGNFAWHFDAFARQSDDFEITGFAESAAQRDAEEEEEHDDDHGDEEEEEEVFGTLENSDRDTESVAFGGSWIGERATIGFAVSRFQNEYGLPGGHAHEHEHGDEDHGDEEEEEEEEGDVRIEMHQTRYDFFASFDAPFAGIDKARLRGAFVDYRHQEIEGSGEIGTLFENETIEARLEMLNAPIAGFTGAFGLQYEDRDFLADGEEAFVPPAEREAIAAFVYQQRRQDRFGVEFGARLERVDYDSQTGPSRDFTTASASFGTIFEASDELHFVVQVDAASRAPEVEELFANGPHLATQTFEIGNPDLDEETAFNISATMHAHFERFELDFSVYSTLFRDFIYLQDAGREEDELPVFNWVQDDARFIGAEFAARMPLIRGESTVTLLLDGDAVRAELDDAPPGGREELPRIPAARLGVGFDVTYRDLAGQIMLRRTFRQDEVAATETETDAFTNLTAYVGYNRELAGTDVELYLRGRNLLNVEQRLNASFLKDTAPLPGRAFEIGVRVEI